MTKDPRECACGAHSLFPDGPWSFTWASPTVVHTEQRCGTTVSFGVIREGKARVMSIDWVGGSTGYHVIRGLPADA